MRWIKSKIQKKLVPQLNRIYYHMKGTEAIQKLMNIDMNGEKDEDSP
jgi:hypothetical protein